MSKGFDIAMIGIDGIGKSVLSVAVTERLVQLGYDARQESWAQQLSAQPIAFEQRLFTDMWHVLVRAIYSGATLADGRPARAVLPVELPELLSAATGELFDGLDVVSNSSRGILTAGSIQLAGDLLFRQQIVDPLVRTGAVVVQDSHSFKSLIKFALLAQCVEGSDHGAAEAFLDAVEGSLYERLRPTIGVIVTGDPQVSLRRRMAQKGRLGALEHYGLAGRPGVDTYIEFQTRLQEHMVRLAKFGTWIELSLSDDLPIDENLRRAVETILSDERVAALLKEARQIKKSDRATHVDDEVRA